MLNSYFPNFRKIDSQGWKNFSTIGCVGGVLWSMLMWLSSNFCFGIDFSANDPSGNFIQFLVWFWFSLFLVSFKSDCDRDLLWPRLDWNVRCTYSANRIEFHCSVSSRHWRPTEVEPFRIRTNYTDVLCMKMKMTHIPSNQSRHAGFNAISFVCNYFTWQQFIRIIMQTKENNGKLHAHISLLLCGFRLQFIHIQKLKSNDEKLQWISRCIIYGRQINVAEKFSATVRYTEYKIKNVRP